MAPFHIEATTNEVVFLGPALRATRVDAGFGHVSSLSRHSRCAKLVGRELAEHSISILARGLRGVSRRRFATLLGAPGVYSTNDEDTISAAMSGERVYNGVGAEDDAIWIEAVSTTHETLVSLGVDSTYTEFEGQGHIPDDSFDKTPLYDFWLASN